MSFHILIYVTDEFPQHHADIPPLLPNFPSGK